MSNLHVDFRTDHDHYMGSPLAPIELIQYGDFQCGSCGEVYVVIKMLQDCFGDLLKFVYRHFPVPSRHPLALQAAVASEAAALQGKFWYMHDMIYENQKKLHYLSFSEFAREINLDFRSFEDCLSHLKLGWKVISDFEGGVRSGVNASPTFFINGSRHEGFDDFDSLYSALQHANDFEYGITSHQIKINQ